MKSLVRTIAVSRVLDRLSRPSPKLESHEEQWRARLLSLMLIVLALATLIGAVYTMNRDGLISIHLTAITLVLALVYLLSRTKHYAIAALMTMAALAVPSFIPFLFEGPVEPVRTNAALLWLGVPLVTASLVLPVRQAIGSSLVLMALPLYFPIFTNTFNWSHISQSTSFLSVLVFLTIISTVIFHLSRKTIQNELSERIRAEVELKRAKDELEARVHERTAALLEMNETLQALVESSPAAVMIVDGEDRVTLWNPAAESIFGWTPREVIGRPNPIDLDADTPARSSSPLFDREAAEPRVGREVKVVTKSGDSVDVSLSTAPLRSPAGEPLGVIGVLLDLREHKRLERQLLHSQKMDAVGQLAGGVAHDFNNLLTVINGFTNVMIEEIDSSDPMKEDLKAVHEAGQRAEALTRQLLAFGRRQMLRPQIIDLNELLDGIGKMLRRLIQEDVTLELKFNPNIGSVEADPGQLEQVVVNLVINACDAMPQGGTLTITTENEDVRESSDIQHEGADLSHAVALRVSDSGTGMTSEVRKRIFEPFFTTKDVGQGTGLGLATVYGIVTQSGGGLAVTSTPGEGSTFSIYLPRIEKCRSPLLSSIPPVLPRGAETILVIEDEELVRNLTVRMLSSLGYRVLTAKNGAEALDVHHCTEHAIDLVLSDVVMPEMGGPESVERMRQVQEDLPALFMSGHADMALDHRGVLASGAPLIEKPFAADELATKVRQLLDAPEAELLRRPNHSSMAPPP